MAPLGPKRHRMVKNEPVALAIVQLHWSKGIGQSISQLVSQQKILFNDFLQKFCTYLLKAFLVDLKTGLDLVLPTIQSCGRIEAGFWGIFIRRHAQPLWSLLYSTIVLYDREFSQVKSHQTEFTNSQDKSHPVESSSKQFKQVENHPVQWVTNHPVGESAIV